MEEAKQIVIRRLEKEFEVIYVDKVIASIGYDETSGSAVTRTLQSLGFEITEKQ